MQTQLHNSSIDIIARSCYVTAGSVFCKAVSTAIIKKGVPVPPAGSDQTAM
jgi:hypothetical protein